jgi:protein phosphatase 2C
MIQHDPFGTERVMGVLNMSRSLGDWSLRPYVSSAPVISRFKLKGDEEYICVASDGLWDVMTDLDVDKIVSPFIRSREKKKQGGNRSKERMNVAKLLVDEAIRRGSLDNITAIVSTLW